MISQKAGSGKSRIAALQRSEHAPHRTEKEQEAFGAAREGQAGETFPLSGPNGLLPASWHLRLPDSFLNKAFMLTKQ
jgi:hypothetical protein